MARRLNPIYMEYNEETACGECTHHISGISVTENLWRPQQYGIYRGIGKQSGLGGFLCNVRRAAAVGCWLWSTEDGNGCQGTVWRRVRFVVGEERLLHLALYQQHSIVAWPVTAQWLVLTVILPLTAGVWHSKQTLAWRQLFLLWRGAVSPNGLVNLSTTTQRDYMQPSSWQQY